MAERRRGSAGTRAGVGGLGARRDRGVYRPRPVAVGCDAAGLPIRVGRAAVEAVREEWLVEDRWWSGEPLSRRYFELVLADGRDVVVMREPAAGGRWFEQRA